MKRILLAGLASLSLAAALPAIGAASPDRARDHGSGAERHHGREHHRGDRRREHRRHEVRHEGFANDTGAAGTVQSFQNGVLTIALAGGSTVSGAVTPDTRIACEAMDENDFTSHDRGSDGGDNGDDNGNDGGDRRDDNNPQCAALLQHAGTTVISAELKVLRGAASWEEVELGS